MHAFVTLFGFAYYCCGSGHQASLSPVHVMSSWMLVLWTVCVLKPLLPFIMHVRWYGSTHFLRPQQGSGLRWLQILIIFSSYSILPLIPWEEVADRVWQEYVKRCGARTMMAVKMESCFLYHTRWNQNSAVPVPFSSEMFLPLYINKQVKV